MPFSIRLALLISLVPVATPAQSFCPEQSGRLIQVAPDVRLRVTDWGGKGPTILFLSGLSSSAHAFDYFAQFLTNDFHVIGITRRGIPPSDMPATGYDATQLTADISAVMDSLEIKQAHIIAWSFGGNEAVMLAVNHPERVRSVVLLDSYDNSIAAGTIRSTTSLRVPAQPFTAADSSSVLAYTWRLRRSGIVTLPVSHYCAALRFEGDGRFAGPAQAASTAQLLRSAMPLLPYSSVRQPVLAFFRTPRARGDEYPDYANMDSVNRAAADFRYPLDSASMALARARLRSEMKSVRIVEIPGATHAIFASHPSVVVAEILSFYRQMR